MFGWLTNKWKKYQQGFCMFTGLPCRVAAIKPDNEQHCVCLHCEAWLTENLPGYEVLRIKRELESCRRHFDACYEIMKVSHCSSKSLACHLDRWRKALEEIAATNGPEGEKARIALRLGTDQKTIDERGYIA